MRQRVRIESSSWLAREEKVHVIVQHCNSQTAQLCMQCSSTSSGCQHAPPKAFAACTVEGRRHAAAVLQALFTC